MKPVLYFAADVISNALAFFATGFRVGCGPLLRVWYLARLRSRVHGAVPVTTQFDGPVYAAPGARVTLGDHCRLGRGVFFETPREGTIRIGAHVRLNRGTVVVGGAAVIIGDHCLIGEYVSIRDSNHGTAPDELMRLQPEVSAPITLGSDVWLGRGVVVLQGVTIGDGAIVAANSVVTRDIPAHVVAAGSPAAVIKERGK